MVGLADQAQKLPGMVSGGQQQRAAIARALANDPPLLVGDEPTGNLDSKTANEVFELFLKLVESGKTMLMVTHDKELATRVPRTIEITNGLITSDNQFAAHPARAPAAPLSHCGNGRSSAVVVSVMVQKVWADLWGNKGRTLQVTLIIAMSAFGVGLVIGGKNLTSQAITNDWLQGDPPAIKINVNPSMDEDQLFALKHIDGIGEVEGFQTATIEWRHNPDEPWRSAILNARDDYLDQKIARQVLLDGQWPTRKIFAMENGFESAYDVSIGDVVQIRIDDREYDVEIGGVLNAFDIAPAFADDLVLYTTRRRFTDLTGREDYNTIAAKDLSFDWQQAEAADTELKDRLDKLEIDSTGAIPPFLDRVAEPERHFAQNILDASFTILGVIGGVIVILGMFLVYNSVSAIIVQQVSQIGVMKAIGARTGQILWVYLLLVITYGVLAAIISVPLAALAAHGIRLFFSSQTGVLDRSFALDPTAVSVQILVALLAPLLASLGPVLSGARITVREAISTYGLGGASGLIERFVASAQLLPYTLLLTIANTFRNKPRLALTQISLVGSGIIFITVLGVRDSTNYTFGTELTSIHQYQVTLQFEEDERVSRIEPMALAQPGVAALEMWNVEKATVRPAMQEEYTVDDRQTILFGLPVDSQMYTPKITTGRWLVPEDERAVVLHEELAAKVGVGVGDWVTFRYRSGKESNWQVVGLLFDPAQGQSGDDAATCPGTGAQSDKSSQHVMGSDDGNRCQGDGKCGG